MVLFEWAPVSSLDYAVPSLGGGSCRCSSCEGYDVCDGAGVACEACVGGSAPAEDTIVPELLYYSVHAT